MDRSREIEMDEVQAIVTAALAEGYHDGIKLWMDARPGGIGSTSCSIDLTISDADSWEKRYLVRIDEVEDDDFGDS